MTTGQHNCVVFAAVVKRLEGAVRVAVINYAFKNELVFSESAGLVESDYVGASPERNFFGFTDKYLAFLEIENGVIDGEVEYHGKLRWHHCGEDQYATEEEFFLATFGVVHALVEHVSSREQRAHKQEEDDPQSIPLFDLGVLSMCDHPPYQFALGGIEAGLEGDSDAALYWRFGESDFDSAGGQ